jgi:hypothetical protein
MWNDRGKYYGAQYGYINIFQIDIIIFTLTKSILPPINTYISDVMDNEIWCYLLIWGPG